MNIREGKGEYLPSDTGFLHFLCIPYHLPTGSSTSANFLPVAF